MQVDAPSSTAASTRDRMKILSFRYSEIRAENSQYRKGAPDDNEASELRSVECAPAGKTKGTASEQCCENYNAPAAASLAIAAGAILCGTRGIAAISRPVYSCSGFANIRSTVPHSTI